MQGDARIGQGTAHHGIARQGLGLVVVVGEDGLHTQFARQAGDVLLGQRVPHDQAGPGLASQLAQGLVQLHQGLADELHPAVTPGQGVQDGLVEDEDGMHLAAGAQGLVQGGVVMGPQVAAEPHQAGRVVRVVGFVQGSRGHGQAGCVKSPSCPRMPTPSI